ncbi:hypothetical protein KFU94_04200 [Chloroflexi bacterium TSY]|nr:hypothetical protein [Chloroflexi bacterium TSY]
MLFRITFIYAFIILLALFTASLLIAQAAHANAALSSLSLEAGSTGGATAQEKGKSQIFLPLVTFVSTHNSVAELEEEMAPTTEESDTEVDRFPLPWRSIDMPAGHYCTGGNHGASEANGGHARDWQIRRQKENGDWVNRYAAIEDNPHCQNGEPGCDIYGRYIIYRVPLYAPADGEIISCWRNFPDNPEPNTPHPKRCC